MTQSNTTAERPLYLYQLTALALVLRLMVVAVSATTHAPHAFYAQASELGELAHSLLSNHTLSSPFGGSTGPSAFLAPGYPFFIATIFRIFGEFTKASVIAITTLQAIFGAATTLATMLLARRLFNNSIANLAGLYWAINLPALFLPLIFWETSFSILALTTVVALALVCGTTASNRLWIALGCVSLLALSVNPSLATAIAACFLWAAFKTPAPRHVPAIVTIACLCVFSLWPIRNERDLHTFIPLRSNLGYELWQGNRPGSSGFFDEKLHPNTNLAEFNRFQSLGEVAYMKEKSTLAKEAIAADPTRFAALTAKRFANFWIGYNPQSTLLMIVYATTTTLLGLTGLILFFRRNRFHALLLALPLILLPLPYYLTHPDFRFRMVIDPILTILATYTLLRPSTHDDSPADQTADSLPY